jgi:hypothetical protein
MKDMIRTQLEKYITKSADLLGIKQEDRERIVEAQGEFEFQGKQFVIVPHDALDIQQKVWKKAFELIYIDYCDVLKEIKGDKK